MSAALRRSVVSLEIPNYRRWFGGQLVSMSGNWMQTVAEMWLVLQLTGSGFAVGVTAALQFLPILAFGAWGGVLADRWPKRSLLIATQAAMVVPALALWALTASGAVEPWMVFALVFIRGAVNSVDNPTRQSFVIEIVGAGRLVNAVGLNSVLVHSARIFGPAGAGVLIATVGVAPCFLINAATFLAMIFALRRMDPQRLAVPEAGGGRGGVLEALRYVRGEPALLIPLGMMAVVGTLAFNFQVVLPLLGRFTFEGGAAAYTALAVAMAIGSVGGALVTGARGRVSESLLIGSAAAFGACSLLVAIAPSLPLAIAALVPLGAVSVTFAAGVNSTLQLDAAPAMRGRVMALYSVVFLGSTPIGGPVVGWLAEVAGPRAGLVLAAVAAAAAALGGWIAFARRRGALAGRSRRRLGRRGAIAVEARGADHPQGLERGGRLDVEAHPVALLDRGDRLATPAPAERGEDRVAGSDHGHLGPDPADSAGGKRKGRDRPKPLERDPARAFGPAARWRCEHLRAPSPSRVQPRPDGRGRGRSRLPQATIRRRRRAPACRPRGRRRRR